MSDPASYHHGDLRNAVLQAALAIVEGGVQGGAAALSLRAVARAAGVSAMAPYHHFADRNALVAALAEIGFQRLYTEKLAALEAIDDPVAALVAGSRAYVAFIIANPKLYRLMKAPELVDRSAYPGLARAAEAPAAKLQSLLTDLAESGRLGGTTPPAAAAMLWGLVHGLGLLAIDGYVPSDHAIDMAGRAAAAMLEGFCG